MLKALKTMQRYAKLFIQTKGKGEVKHMEKLTTKELLVLSVLEQAEKLEDCTMAGFSWESLGINDEYDINGENEYENITDFLIACKYIQQKDEDGYDYTLTCLGYHYLRMCEEEIESAKAQIENGNKPVNFSLINIDGIDIQLGLINSKVEAQLGASKIYNGFKTLIDMMHKKK